MKVYDAGSIPSNGLNVVEIFKDKLKAGIDIPKYPQIRDMNEMFLDYVNGLERTSNGYKITGEISIDNLKIGEVVEIERNSKNISEALGEPFKMGLCITGPYTLSLKVPEASGPNGYWIFEELGNVVGQITESNMFNNKNGRVVMVSIDEPSFGTFDDPSVSIGFNGRNYLLKAWENIANKAKNKNANVSMHLHATGDRLPWEVGSVKIIESHVDDLLYHSNETKELLNTKDKFLKASIAKTNFDELIFNRLLNSGANESNVGEKVKAVWKSIKSGNQDPILFVEDKATMKKRLEKIIGFFDEERVPYSGPECGLESFPNYNSTLECLRRVSKVTHSF